MKENVKIVPRQVHTRSLDRNVARNNMKKRGFTRINKGDFFSKNWRKYVEV